MAMLVAGLLCVASFSACSDDDDDSKKYTYELSAELTDPGSMTTAEIQANETSLNYLENTYNAELSETPMTSKRAKQIFDTIVKEFKDGLKNTPNNLTQAVKFTFSMTNKSSGKVQFSEVVTIQPAN